MVEQLLSNLKTLYKTLYNISCNNNKYFAQCKYASGGANGSQPRSRAQAVNPCAPAGPRQASRRHSFCYAAPVCCVSLYHFTHQQRPTYWRSRHQKAGFWKTFTGLETLTSLGSGSGRELKTSTCAIASQPSDNQHYWATHFGQVGDNTQTLFMHFVHVFMETVNISDVTHVQRIKNLTHNSFVIANLAAHCFVLCLLVRLMRPVKADFSSYS